MVLKTVNLKHYKNTELGQNKSQSFKLSMKMTGQGTGKRCLKAV